jgi:hypothetical protein
MSRILQERTMLREFLTVGALLALAALLESGGDAAIRQGLLGRRWGFLVGPVALVAYGFLVNVTRWEFSRLMGVYIAVFFVVSQLLALFLFRERLQVPTLVGGALIVTGGLVLMFWKPAA